MRTIKFRGRDDEGRWHYGNLTYRVTKEDAEEAYVRGQDGLYCPVDPSTVGELICEADDRRPEIYEGDVIEFSLMNTKQTSPVFWDYDTSSLSVWIHREDGDEEAFPLSLIFVALDSKKEEIKILGNIHDNPELEEIALY